MDAQFDTDPRHHADDHDGHRLLVDSTWSPPTTRAEATSKINELSHDVTLILAQLAEGAHDWCARTGRDEHEYARWRRSALFAKAHKENQLRECKRLRHALADSEGAPTAEITGAAAELEHLRRLCRQVIAAWSRGPRADAVDLLDTAVRSLAAYIHGAEGSVADTSTWDLQGVRAIQKAGASAGS